MRQAEVASVMWQAILDVGWRGEDFRGFQEISMGAGDCENMGKPAGFF